MKRTPERVLELPEVRPSNHPRVECRIHPGQTVSGVAICVHVLGGAQVFFRSEPTHDAWGAMLCELCMDGFNGRDSQADGFRLRLACEKCVHYHFLSRDQEQSPDGMSEQDFLAFAEREGLRCYRRVRDGKNQHARNPFDTPLVRWAWNLGFRLGRYLDEAKTAAPQAATQ